MLKHEVNLIACAVPHREIGRCAAGQCTCFVQKHRERVIKQLQAGPLSTIRKIGILHIDKKMFVNQADAREYFFAYQQTAGRRMVNQAWSVELTVVLLTYAVMKS